MRALIRQAKRGVMVRPHMHWFWSQDQRASGQVNTRQTCAISRKSGAYHSADGSPLTMTAAATQAPLWIAVPRYNRGRIRHLVAHAIDSGRARALGPEAAPWAEPGKLRLRSGMS